MDFCSESGTSLVVFGFSKLKKIIMETKQKETTTCSSEQLKRLEAVKCKEWKEAQEALMPTIARLLKRLKRRVCKKSYPMGKGRKRENLKVKSEKFNRK